MTRCIKFITSICILALSGCSYVLDEPAISKVDGDGKQESIVLKVTPVSESLIQTLNKEPFRKTLIIPKADQEKLHADSKQFSFLPPPSTSPMEYRAGVGDVFHFATIKPAAITLENPAENETLVNDFKSVQSNSLLKRQILPPSKKRSSLTQRESRVSADGTILFLETGQLQVLGKTLSEVRFLVAEALIRNGGDPRFQLEIIEFNSQTISLISYNSPVKNLNSESVIGAALFRVTDRPTTLRELLVEAGLILKKNVLELVSIQRANKRYQLTLEKIFDPNSPNYFLQGGDVVTVEAFKYKRENVYILGGRSVPQLIEVAEEERLVLADALFQREGVLSALSSKKSEVYLLRGQNPLNAYQIDATDPARLTLATKLELRPNDIIFASTVPIVDFNTVLALINPLRILTGQEQSLFSPAF